MAKIRHIAIFSDDPERLAEFYSDVYGILRRQCAAVLYSPSI